ncbi:4'-phosphopantetheinyl transferase sfp [compost metagenome]
MTVARLELLPDQVHVWMAACDTVEPQWVQRYRTQLLSEQERAMEMNFHFPRDRLQYVVTRALVRCVLSRYSDVAPSDWCFGKTDHGQPTIVGPQGAGEGMTFNISHSGSLVVLGVTRQARLGVDTEALARGDDFIAIGRRSFSPLEVAELDALPPTRRRHGYIAHWTLKEAYVKARGVGLSIALDSFAFHRTEDERIEFHRNGAAADTSDWHFSLVQPCASHMASICYQRHDGRAPQVSFRRMQPLIGEHFCDVTLLAHSA